MSSPNVPQAGNHLEAVTVAASNSAYAVGSSYTSGGQETSLIEHWNGTSWSIMPSANLGTPENSLHGVTTLASNPDDAWAVGDADDGSSTPDVTLTLHEAAVGRCPLPASPAHPGVLDNLNTHTVAALYARFPAPEAWRLARKLEFHYTPYMPVG